VNPITHCHAKLGSLDPIRRFNPQTAKINEADSAMLAGKRGVSALNWNFGT
jgi:hypothetical protein